MSGTITAPVGDGSSPDPDDFKWPPVDEDFVIAEMARWAAIAPARCEQLP